MRSPPIRIVVTGSARRGYPMWIANWFSLYLAGARAVRVTPGSLKVSRFKQYDGLLVGGGDDIGAQIYGGMPVPDVRVDPERDRLELEALEHFLPTGKPVFGVCRGAQMLNVALGGSLHSDIYEVYEKAPRLRTVLPRKTVCLAADTTLLRICRKPELRVNSLHHQAVDRLGDDLRIAAKDTVGIVQAVECSATNYFRVGVQWHPEFLPYRPSQMRLFRSFVAEARRAREERTTD